MTTVETMTAAAAVAFELSKLTGRSWVAVEPEYRGAYVTRDDGLTLWLSAGYGKPCVTLSLTPEETAQRRPYSDPALPEIGANFLTRTAAAVARDLIRRLLPGAEAYRAELAERIERANAYRSNVADNLTRLTDAAPGVLTRVRDDAADVRAGVVWGSVRVSGESVTLELRSLSVTSAAAILALINRS